MDQKPLYISEFSVLDLQLLLKGCCILVQARQDGVDTWTKILFGS